MLRLVDKFVSIVGAAVVMPDCRAQVEAFHFSDKVCDYRPMQKTKQRSQVSETKERNFSSRERALLDRLKGSISQLGFKFSIIASERLSSSESRNFPFLRISQDTNYW